MACLFWQEKRDGKPLFSSCTEITHESLVLPVPSLQVESVEKSFGLLESKY